jgi:hypothetical protein
MKPFASGR